MTRNKQTEVSSGGTKIIIIQDTKPQNIMMPPVHYAQDPYYNTPQFEPYPAHPSYSIPPDGMGFTHPYTDANSYFQENQSAAAYEQSYSTSFQSKPPNAVVPSAPPYQWSE